MHRRSRFTLAVTAITICALFFLYASGYGSWTTWEVGRSQPPSSLLHDVAFYRDEIQKQSAGAFRSAWPYSRHVVVPIMAEDDLSWMNEQLSDLLEPMGNFSMIQYVVNDRTAKYHTPANKGNEAMAYLSYMIDFYDRFPDVSIFIHGKDTEWHNNNLLNDSTSVMLHHLNLDKIVRDGYVNLRCQWDPGCPDQIHPYTSEMDFGKLEETLFLEAWKELFQSEKVPEVFAQPCCSQFAVSRERLQGVPKHTYVRLRDWLTDTYLANHDSGRIFEYTWQYLFNHGAAIFCPDPRVCYCELYGICFPDMDGYDAYFDLRLTFKCCEEDLKEWEMQKEDWEEYNRNRAMWLATHGKEEPTPPQEGADVPIRRRCDAIRPRMAALQQAAVENGRDAQTRATLLNRGWADMTSLPRDSPECKRENLPTPPV